MIDQDDICRSCGSRRERHDQTDHCPEGDGWSPTRTFRKVQPPVEQRSRPEPQETEAEIYRNLNERFAGIRARMKEFELEIRPAFEEMDQTTPCEHHPERILSADWDKTLERSWPDRALTMRYSTCPDCLADREYERRNADLAKLGIPRKLQNATFETFETGDRADDWETQELEKALAQAKRQTRKGKGFVLLLGGFGSGKSHLATSMIRAKKSGRFITHGELISEIRATYNPSYTGKSREEIIRRYQETPCLVLDELGIRSGGKDEEHILYSILAHRHDRDMLTAITSNHELEEVRQILGGALIDRMAEDYEVVNLTVPSFRRGKKE